jgi:hypothetical protein
MVDKYYKITDYSFDRAKEIGVIIKPSQKGNYKIDVYDKTGDYITSIGHRQYKDYGQYLKTNGKEYADYRRSLFYKRHGKYKKGTRGWYSSYILW